MTSSSAAMQSRVRKNMDNVHSTAYASRSITNPPDQINRRPVIKMGMNMTKIHSVKRTLSMERTAEQNTISKTGPKLVKPIVTSKDSFRVPALHRRQAGNKSVAKRSTFASDTPLPSPLHMFSANIDPIYVGGVPEINITETDCIETGPYEIIDTIAIPTTAESATAHTRAAEISPPVASGNIIDSMMNEQLLAEQNRLARQSFPAPRPLIDIAADEAAREIATSRVDDIIADLLKQSWAKIEQGENTFKPVNPVDKLAESLSATSLSHPVIEKAAKSTAINQSRDRSITVTPQTFDDLAVSFSATYISGGPINITTSSVEQMLSTIAGAENPVQGLFAHSQEASPTSNATTAGIEKSLDEIIARKQSPSTSTAKQKRLTMKKRNRKVAATQTTSCKSARGLTPAGRSTTNRPFAVTCPWSTTGVLCNAKHCSCKADAREAHRWAVLRANRQTNRVTKKPGGTNSAGRRTSTRSRN
ncbi:Fc.00g019920.m01.CDS01 [Cosmosporella sp. VM-42]